MSNRTKLGKTIRIVAIVLMGLTAVFTLATPLWVSNTHTMNSYNLVHVLDIPLLMGGSALLIAGIIRFIRAGGLKATKSNIQKKFVTVQPLR